MDPEAAAAWGRKRFLFLSRIFSSHIDILIYWCNFKAQMLMVLRSGEIHLKGWTGELGGLNVQVFMLILNIKVIKLATWSSIIMTGQCVYWSVPCLRWRMGDRRGYSSLQVSQKLWDPQIVNFLLSFRMLGYSTGIPERSSAYGNAERGEQFWRSKSSSIAVVIENLLRHASVSSTYPSK